MVGSSNPPEDGDTVVFFYAPAGADEPGFYGRAVVTRYEEKEGDKRLYFRPAAPSDHLKMFPWWDEAAKKLADEIRVPVAQGTLWPVSAQAAAAIRKGITSWLGNRVAGHQGA
jgi:hypothetical protein